MHQLAQRAAPELSALIMHYAAMQPGLAPCRRSLVGLVGRADPIFNRDATSGEQQRQQQPQQQLRRGCGIPPLGGASSSARYLVISHLELSYAGRWGSCSLFVTIITATLLSITVLWNHQNTRHASRPACLNVLTGFLGSRPFELRPLTPSAAMAMGYVIRRNVTLPPPPAQHD